MGRFSEMDIEIRQILDEEVLRWGLSNSEREEYINNNYDVVAGEVYERYVNASRMQ